MSSPEIRGDWVVWIVRTLMVGLSSIGIGLVSYVGNRIVTAQDETGRSIHRLEIHALGTSNTVDRIQQEMVLRRQTQQAWDDEIKSALADHETRIRAVERDRQHRAN